MNKTAWGITALAVVMLAALASCSSSSTAAPSTVVASTSTSATATPSASTISTTIAATTTTTIGVEEQIKASYLQLYNGYWACLRAPDKCDPSSQTSSVGPARAALTKTVKDLVSGGLFAGSEDAGYVVVEKVVLTDPTMAVVSSCWWDTGILYGPPAAAGGLPIVVNNIQATSRFDTTIILENGNWRTSEEKRTERTEGENRCAPES